MKSPDQQQGEAADLGPEDGTWTLVYWYAARVRVEDDFDSPMGLTDRIIRVDRAVTRESDYADVLEEIARIHETDSEHIHMTDVTRPLSEVRWPDLTPLDLPC
jgi:hypothetical protein